jgi:hypothetical protein
MQIQHVNVKLLMQGHVGDADLEPLIPVFHNWIENQNGDELLIDVADYRHVHGGPGIVLIGHEANYSVDNTGNRWGIRYNRKGILDGSNQDRLTQAVRAALSACQRLEAELRLVGKLRFDGREIELFVNDRLAAPNNAETRAAADPEFQQFFGKLFSGKEYSISYGSETRSLFTANVKAARPVTASELLSTLA